MRDQTLTDTFFDMTADDIKAWSVACARKAQSLDEAGESGARGLRLASQHLMFAEAAIRNAGRNNAR